MVTAAASLKGAGGTPVVREIQVGERPQGVQGVGDAGHAVVRHVQVRDLDAAVQPVGDPPDLHVHSASGVGYS